MPVLTESGSIYYQFSDPRTANEFVSIREMVVDFLEYMKLFPDVHKEWKIANPPKVIPGV